MNKVVVITGASSGFGALIAKALAKAGHTVYAGMRHTADRNKPQVEAANRFSSEHGVKLIAVEMDVASQPSVDEAIATILAQQGRIDVVVHNAGHMVFGAAEAFTTEQFAEIYDANVLSTQRVNRAVLPHLRGQRSGLVVWIGSTSTRGGTPPYLSPYFAAKAGMDALAVSYAAELNRWGIETTIIVPGAFTSGTNHFANAGSPSDKERQAEYDKGPYANLGSDIMDGFKKTAPADADVNEVAKAVVRVVDAETGARPFRVHIDPANDGAEVVNAVADHIRTEFYRNIGLPDLLRVRQE